MSQIVLKSRALAVYIELTAGVQTTPTTQGFALSADADSTNSVMGKSVWQWEREFNDSPFAAFNQRLRTLGDEQRELIKLSKQEPIHG